MDIVKKIRANIRELSPFAWIAVLICSCFGGTVGLVVAFCLPGWLNMSNFEGAQGYAAMWFSVVLVPLGFLIIGYLSFRYRIIRTANSTLSILAIAAFLVISLMPETPISEIRVLIKNNSSAIVTGYCEDVSSRLSSPSLEPGEDAIVTEFPLAENRELVVYFRDTSDNIICKKRVIPYSMVPHTEEEFLLEVTLLKDDSIEFKVKNRSAND